MKKSITSTISQILTDNGDAPPQAAEMSAPSSDPFDLKNLRLSQSQLVAPAKKLISSYSVRKPKSFAFFRVHPGEDYQAEAYLYTDKDEDGMNKEVYLVSTVFAARLDDELLSAFKPHKLYLAIERHAEKPFLWPVRFTLNGEKDNEHWRTARQHAETAKSEWVRIEAKEGSYQSYLPAKKLPEPAWVDIPFNEILRLGFKGRVIDNLDHPIIKDLRGET